MTFWLLVGVRYSDRKSGVEPEQYDRIIDLANFAGNSIARGFDGASWLRKRFPAKSLVRIELRARPVERVSVEKFRLKSYGGPKEILCLTHIPASWLATPGHGLLGIRLFRAVLSVLREVGDRYGIGLPQVRSEKTDPGKPELIDPFAHQPTGPSPYAADSLALYEIADGAEPDQLVLAAKEPAAGPVRVAQDAVARSLGRSEAERFLPGVGGGRVRVWIVRQDYRTS